MAPLASVALVRRYSRRMIVALAFGAATFAGYIAALAASLPSHHVAGHWNVTWVGFDILQFASMVVAAWAFGWRPRLAPAAFLVTAVLLVCDAWFDVTTASGASDVTVSLLFALLLELPLAAAFAWGSRRQARWLAARSALDDQRGEAGTDLGEPGGADRWGANGGRWRKAAAVGWRKAAEADWRAVTSGDRHTTGGGDRHESAGGDRRQATGADRWGTARDG